MFSAAAPPAPVGSASGSDRSHPSLGPNVASAGLYSAFVEFERTTLYKLRRKLLGDFRAFILGLVEKLAAEEAARVYAEKYLGVHGAAPGQGGDIDDEFRYAAQSR